MNSPDQHLKKDAEKIAALLGDIELLPDPAIRTKVTEITQGLLALYGEGLARMLEIVHQGGDPAAVGRLLQAFTEDELVSQLLLLHDLHPVDLETRVAKALEQVRPHLEAQGGKVELLGVERGCARVRVQSGCSSCSSSTATLKRTVEEALYEAAPDLDRVEIIEFNVLAPEGSSFIPLAALLRT